MALQPLEEGAGALRVTGKSTGAPPRKEWISIYISSGDVYLGGERSIGASMAISTTRLNTRFIFSCSLSG